MKEIVNSVGTLRECLLSNGCEFPESVESVRFHADTRYDDDGLLPSGSVVLSLSAHTECREITTGDGSYCYLHVEDGGIIANIPTWEREIIIYARGGPRQWFGPRGVYIDGKMRATMFRVIRDENPVASE